MKESAIRDLPGPGRPRPPRPRLLPAAVLRGEEGGLAGLCPEAADAGGLAESGQRRRHRRAGDQDRPGELDPRRAAQSRCRPTPRWTLAALRAPRGSPGAASGRPGRPRPRSWWSRRPPFRRSPPSFAETPVDTLQAWLAFNVADNAAPYLSKPSHRRRFEMRQKTLSGQAEKRSAGSAASPRSAEWTAATVRPLGNLGWAVGELYTARYFPPAAKAHEGPGRRPEGATRPHRETRLDVPAHQGRGAGEARRLQLKVGYPDKPRDYSKLWCATTTWSATSAAPPRPTGRFRSTASTGRSTAIGA